jgi:hypothetical protein
MKLINPIQSINSGKMSNSLDAGQYVRIPLTIKFAEIETP